MNGNENVGTGEPASSESDSDNVIDKSDRPADPTPLVGSASGGEPGSGSERLAVPSDGKSRARIGQALHAKAFLATLPPSPTRPKPNRQLRATLDSPRTALELLALEPPAVSSEAEYATRGDATEAQQRAFAVVKSARQSLAGRQSLSPNTLLDYRRKSARLRRQLRDPATLDPQAWGMLLRAYTNNAKTFRHYRAALAWAVRQEIALTLKVQDAMQRSGNRDESWYRAVDSLRSLSELHAAIDGLDRVDFDGLRALPSRSRRGTRKRDDLKTIRDACPQWLSRFLLAMRRSTHLDAVRLLARVGCRPEELLKGVRIERGSPGMFKVRIDGAKVTVNAGQAWREIELPERRLPRSWAQRLEQAPAFIIQIASKDALKSAMRRASKRALPGLPAVTAYVLRHAMASAARDDGREAEDVAALLGHAVADTQRGYGWRRARGGRRNSTHLAQATVKTARPVRPLDRSKLLAITQRHTGRRPKKRGSA